MASPAFSVARSFVVLPIDCTMSVMVPFVESLSAMVRGIRSPVESTRIMTKLPAFLLRAIKGASMTYFVIVGARTVFSTMGYISAFGRLMIDTDGFLNTLQGMCQAQGRAWRWKMALQYRKLRPWVYIFAG